MSAVFYRDSNPTYPLAARSGGMYIHDSEGKAYLDMCGGAAVSCLGHGHPEVVDAIRCQVETMAFAHTAFFSNEPQEQLAEILCNHFSEAGAKAYFTSGGSEANETALKLAWQYWQVKEQPHKIKIIGRQHSYHGNTVGALSVSGNPARRAPVEAMLHDWPRIEACYAYRHQRNDETDQEYGIRAAAQLEDAILRAGPETVAAFIAEPVVGASLGAVTAANRYFVNIRNICDKYDVLLIADEVMCGTGRTGTFFAHEQENIIPDIVTLAKGLGGGFQPLAATIVRRHVAEAFEKKPFSHGHTYVGHATACAASVAVCRAIEKHHLMDKVSAHGAYFLQALLSNFSEHPNVGDIRGRGLFQAIELVGNRDSKERIKDGATAAAHIKAKAMEKGLMIYPSGGSENCHILFAPPYILEKSHIDEAIDILKSVLVEVLDA
ncbi:MAG: aspartate aminotransferase family protein [Kordiimonas sp.]